MNIRNKRIVITGATSGIGQQLMVQLSAYEGTKIIAVGRQMRNIPIAMNIIPFKAELSQEQDIDALFDFAIREMGGIDIFISNAGSFYFNTHETAQWEDFEDLFKTNVLASIYATKKMLDLHENTTEEFLVGITVSGIANLPYPGNPVYMGTKSALDGFIKGARFEFPPHGHITGIYPMGIRHGSLWEDLLNGKKQNEFPGKAQTPQEIARAIIRGIEKNRKSIYPNPVTRMVVYLSHVFPFVSDWYSNQLAKREMERKESAAREEMM